MELRCRKLYSFSINNAKIFFVLHVSPFSEISACFQCKDGACTLSAMTSGIRRNWIQAIMKNVRPTIAPDVTR